MEAEVRPTEDLRKVKEAILNVFTPDLIEVVDEDSYKRVVARAFSFKSLIKLHSKLRQERILDAARGYLVKGSLRDMLIFKINKQAAYIGKVSFVDSDSESPMGPITFIITTYNVRDVIDWLAPPTKMGRPLYERPMPLC